MASLNLASRGLTPPEFMGTQTFPCKGINTQQNNQADFGSNSPLLTILGKVMITLMVL